MRVLLVAYLLLLTALNLNAQTIQVKLIDPTSVSICEESIIGVELTNTSNLDISNFKFSIQLPKGLQYKLLSISGANESNVNNISRPEFLVPLIRPSAKIVCNLIIYTECEAFDASNDAVMLRNRIIFNYNNTTDSIISDPPFNLFSPFLLTQDVPDISKESSNTVYRQIKITNTRLGSIKNFRFVDDHDSAQIFSTNGILLTNTLTQLSLQFNGRHFEQIGDKDSLFERDEVLIIDEVINNLDCNPKTIRSTLQSFWGCGNKICQTSEKYGIINFVKNTSLADIVPTAIPKIIDCICAPSGHAQELIFTNRGGADAENVEIEIFTGAPLTMELYGIVKDSLRFEGNVTVDSIFYFDEIKNNLCKAKIFYKLRLKINNFPANEFIRIHFRYGTCLTEPPLPPSRLPWKYNFSYTTKCVPNSAMQARNRIAYIPENNDTLRNSLSVSENIMPISPEKIIDFKHSITISKELRNANLIVSYYIPCIFTLHDSTFLLQNKKPVSINRQTNIDGSQLITLIYTAPLPAFSEQILKLSASCSAPCLKLKDIEASRLKLSSCKFKELDEVKLLSQLCANVQLTCIDTACICGPRSISKMNIELECIDKATVDTIPAYLDFSSALYRSNLGSEDNNDDRLKQNQTMDTNLVDLKSFLSGDTMIHEFKSIVITDDPLGNYDSISFYVRNIVELLTLNSEFTIWDKSQNKYYHSSFPSKNFKDTTKLLACGATISQGNSIGQGLYTPFTPEIARANGMNLPLDFSFEQGDSIYCKIITRFVNSTADNIFRTTISHYAFLFDRKLNTKARFSCGINNYKTQFLTNIVSFTQSETKVIQCGENLDFPIFTFKENPLLNNLFTNEFRHILQIDSCILSPFGNYPGMEVLSADLNYYYYDSSISATRLILSRTVPFSNKGYFLLSNSFFDTLSFDENYILDIRINARVTDCKLFSNGPSKKFNFNIYFHTPSDNPFHLGQDYKTFYTKSDFSKFIELETYTGSSKLDFIEKNIISAAKEIEWRANVFNNSYSGSYLFNIQSKKGLIKNINITPDTSYVVKKINDSIFHLFYMKKTALNTLRFTAENNACDGDSICIIASWYCSDTFATNQKSCDITSYVIEVKDKNPLMELNVIQNSRSVNLCDTIPEYMIELYNANEGTAYNVFLDINIPQGIKLIPSSIFIDHAESNGFIPLALPILLSNNTYRWDFNNIINTHRTLGLSGVNSFPKNRIRIKFKAITDCDAFINSYFTFYSSAVSNCNEKSNEVFRSTNKIQINNVNVKNTVQVFTKTISSTLKDDIDLEIEVQGSANFNDKDSIEIILPLGVKYVSNSMSPILGIQKSEPRIIIKNGVQILRFGLLGNPPTNNLKFSIKTYCWNNLQCNTFDINFNTFYNDVALCISTGMFCNIYLQTSQNLLKIDRFCPQLNITQLKIKNSNNDISLDLELKTNYSDAFKNDSLCIAIYADIDGDQKLTSSDSKIKEFSEIYKNLNSGIAKSYSILLESAQIKSCGYFALTIPKTCICDLDTAYINIPSLSTTHSFFEICAGAEVQIGLDSTSNSKYSWLNTEIPCKNCPIYLFKSSLNDSNSIKEYRLIDSLSSNCTREHIFTIRVNKLQNGKKHLIESCKSEQISISSPVNKFLWTGKQLLDSTNKTLKFIATEDQTILLHYNDNNQCKVIDTFCIKILDLVDNLNISSDTTIVFGAKANIWVKGAASINWSPSNTIECSSCPSTQAMPMETTLYTAEIIDSHGCKKILDVLVTVIFPDCDSTNLFLPNAFSPNGDSHNDLLFVRAKDIDRINFVIYNRWGEKVFETHDVLTPWDGRYQGKSLGPDVFGYCIEAYCLNGTKLIRRGNVSLIK
jgi:gliding motility-associated-like protein